jgi:hypothetical protein
MTILVKHFRQQYMITGKDMRRYYFFISIFLFFTQISQAQNAKYQSDLVFRLANHVTWAGYHQPYKFVIGVAGNREDFKFFQSNAISQEFFGDQPVEIRYYECTDKLEECDLIYISKDCRIGVENIVKKTRKKPILIISGNDGDGMAGAVINFIDKQGKVKFELNESQAAQRGLMVSEELKALAILI